VKSGYRQLAVKQYGGGVLVRDPMVSGRTFIDADDLDEWKHLEFVSRR
jgi:hypothetical protein